MLIDRDGILLFGYRLHIHECVLLRSVHRLGASRLRATVVGSVQGPGFDGGGDARAHLGGTPT